MLRVDWLLLDGDLDRLASLIAPSSCALFAGSVTTIEGTALTSRALSLSIDITVLRVSVELAFSVFLESRRLATVLTVSDELAASVFLESRKLETFSPSWVPSCKFMCNSFRGCLLMGGLVRLLYLSMAETLTLDSLPAKGECYSIRVILIIYSNKSSLIYFMTLTKEFNLQYYNYLI